jgi:uncharacterized protein YozE (UPF0346 family)
MRFHAWLMKNRWRSDPIGDFARDVHRDASWPRRANTWRDVKDALPSTACDGAERAMRAAWREYELYVGGPSHLDKGTWVWGATGGFLGSLEPPIPPRPRPQTKVKREPQ